MRLCESCRKPDSCIVDYETPCNPKLCPPTADERAETHHDQCPKLTHEVRPLYRTAQRLHTPEDPMGELSPKLKREGWKLKQDGCDVFRWRMLCRQCIQNIYDAEERQKDYVKACKKAAGQDDQTYSQMLAMQSAI